MKNNLKLEGPKKENQKQSSKKNKRILPSLIFLASLFLFNTTSSFAWTGPPGAPPTCPAGAVGCDFLLNTGATVQTKTGGINFATTSGNVGIGKSSPSYKLDVTGTARFTGALTGLSAIFSSTVAVGTPTGDTHAVTKGYVDAAMTNASSKWTTSGTNIYNINTGNVGIGTTNPTSLLSINGSLAVGSHSVLSLDNLDWFTFAHSAGYGNISFFAKANGTTFVNTHSSVKASQISSGNGILSFQTSFSNDGIGVSAGLITRMLINSVGNVGIGTTSPAYKLDVNGTARFTGAVIVPTPSTEFNPATKGYVDSTVSSGVTSGAVIAGSTSVGYLKYNGKTALAGALDGGTTLPSGTNRLNYGGYLYATQLYDGGTRVAISSRSITAGDGITGGGNLTANRTIAVNSTVIRTTGNQTLGGVKTFSSSPVVITPTDGTHATNKSYVDTAVSGAASKWTTSGTNTYLTTTTNNVGIGTTNPVMGKIHIISGDNKDSGPIIALSGSLTNQIESGRIRFLEFTANNYQGAFIHYNGSSNALNIGVHEVGDAEASSDINAITILRSNGNVGINTTSPSYKLDVNGTARFTGAVIVPTPSASNNAATKGYVDSTVSSGVTSGAVIAGSTSVGYLKYNGKTALAGALDGGTTLPSGTNRLNYGGYLYATQLYDGGTRVAISSRSITAGDGITGGGNLTANRTIAVNSTVIRTTGNQTLGGIKTFSSSPVVITPTDGTHATNKSYVDTAVAGAASKWTTSGTNTYLTVTGNNVGIGTTSPGEKLEVNGKLKIGNNTISGENITFDGNTTAGMRVSNTYGYVNITPLNDGWAHMYTDRARFIFNTEVQIIGGILNAYNNVDLKLGTASGAEKMRITTAGNVGIGTSAPGYKLDVSGTGRFTSTVSVATPTASNHATTKAYVDTVAQTSNYLRSTDSRNENKEPQNYQKVVQADFKANATDSLLDGGTYHGILSFRPYGNTTDWSGGPMYQLGFTQNQNLWMRTSVGDSNWSNWKQINSPWTTSGTNTYLTTTTNNIGIGTTSPSYKLDVNGTARFTGAVIVPTPSSEFNPATKGYVDSTVSSGVTSGAVIAGSTSVGYLKYNGKTALAGALDGGTTLPSGTNRLNYGGYLYATQLYDGGTRVAISSRSITAGDGITGGGNLTANRTIAVNSTVIRTTGNQTLGGIKTFSSSPVVITPTDGTHATNKSYVDTAVAGAASKWTTSGTNTYLTTTTNNVGIGTNSPVAKLNIKQGMSDYGTAFTSPHLKLQTSTTIDTTGFVGITYDASTSLNYGWSVGALRTSNGNSNFVWKYHASSEEGTERMRIDQNGNVGINTTSPSYKLDVNGTARFTGAVIVGTPSEATHAATKGYVDSTVSSGVTSGAVIAGSTSVGYLKYNGKTALAGALDGGTTLPSGTNRLNYGGYLYATQLYDGGTRVAISSRSITAGDGITGGGNLTANRTIAVNSTVIRTTGNQTLGGVKTFSGTVIVPTPTSSTYAANKSYVDTAVSGAASKWTTSGTNTYLTATGNNVGIGVTSPTAKLDIAGNMKVSGLIYSGNSLYVQQNIYTINASSLDVNTWYPVTFGSNDLQLDCEIQSPSLGGAAAYNKNMIRFLLTAKGWSDLPKRLEILSYGTYQNDEITIGAIAYGTKNGERAVYIRGGMSYQFKCNAVPTLRSTSYSFGTDPNIETYTPTVDLGSLGTNITRAWVYTDTPSTSNGISKFSNIYSNGIDVSGTGRFTGTLTGAAAAFSSTVSVGTPTSSNHATTKSYVDTAIGSAASKWTTSGTNIYSANTGNVGIGIASPITKLHLYQGTPSSNMTPYSGTQLTLDSNNTNSFITFRNSADNGTYQGLIFSDNNNGGYLLFRNSISGQETSDSMILGSYNKFVFQTGTSGVIDGKTTQMTILQNGNVGIGQATPAYKLDVSGTGRFTGKLTGAAAAFSGTVSVGTPTSSNHATTKSYVDGLVTGASSKWTVSGTNTYLTTTGNNVGIGTTTPTAKLHLSTVNGDSFMSFEQTGETSIWSLGLEDGNAPMPQEAFIISRSSTLDANPFFSILTSGNVGIGNTAPGYKLDVSGTGRFTGTVAVATPTASNHATTKSYVDGGFLKNTGNISLTGNLNMATYKLTVGTIDPLFEINDKHYATYAPSMTGVKEESTGVIEIDNSDCIIEDDSLSCNKEIDFDNEKDGSNLWVFRNVTDFEDNWKGLQIILTSNFNGNVWYNKYPEENKIIFHLSTKDLESENMEISYRFTANRFDYKEWTNTPEGVEKGMGFKVK